MQIVILFREFRILPKGIDLGGQDLIKGVPPKILKTETDSLLGP